MLHNKVKNVVNKKKEWSKGKNQDKKERKGDKRKVKFSKKPAVIVKKSPEKANKKEITSMKKVFKKKLKGEGVNVSEEEIKLFQLKKKQRKIERKKKENSIVFERSIKLKVIWEKLRKEGCELDEKNDLLAEATKLIKGHAKELTYAHDTVRVLECVFGLGSLNDKALLFDELKDSIIVLAKSKYGKFFVIKVLRHGTKEQKQHVVKEFHSKVIELISHTEAAEVVEVAFNECTSATQRIELVQEFYGPTFRYFKDTDMSLKKVLVKEPEKKSAIILHMKEAIMKLFKKAVIRHSMVHYVLREFLTQADQQSRLEVIETVRLVLAEMLHTKDGARAAMYCVWHGTAKDRKAIVKSFKSHVVKIAKEEHGHLVLLSLFDSVDDTKLMGKHIISELLTHILDLSQNLHGRKVLLYLISPRNTIHFCPDIIKILQEGDNNEASKKDAEKRRAELKEIVSLPMAKLVADNISKLYKDNSFCLETFTITKHAIGHHLKAFKSIANQVAVDYFKDADDMHIIESPGSSFMLRKLITEDKSYEQSEDQACFSIVLMEVATIEAVKSWTNCNRGCFLLVNLLETGIPSVIDSVKEALHGYHTQLSKKTFPGAAVLLKKIKTM